MDDVDDRNSSYDVFSSFLEFFAKLSYVHPALQNANENRKVTLLKLL